MIKKIPIPEKLGALSSHARDLAIQTLTNWVISRKREEHKRRIPPPRTQGFVTSFDSTKIYWELHGPQDPTKRPIVFCYGLVCSMNMWRAQLERYSKDHACLLIDYRGHHRSQTPSDLSHMNISAIARDVAAAIRAQAFDQPAHIWGHSMGVNVAMELAVSQPELCQSLTLICGTMSNPFNGMFGTDVLEKVADPILKGYPDNKELFHLIWRLALVQTKLARTVAGIAGFNDKASKPEDMDAYVQAVTQIDPSTFFPLITEMTKGMTSGIAPKIKTPSTIVAGALDHVTPARAQRALAEAIPGAVYFEFPAGSHNVHLDFGEYVCMKVEESWRERGLE